MIEVTKIFDWKYFVCFSYFVYDVYWNRMQICEKASANMLTSFSFFFFLQRNVYVKCILKDFFFFILQSQFLFCNSDLLFYHLNKLT